MKCLLWKSLVLFCLITLVSEARAQDMSTVHIHEIAGIGERDCPDRDAGTVRLGTMMANSNDINLTRSFLCANDAFNIIHNGDGDIMESDPDPSTPAGVGYAWYVCPPTIEGTTLDDIVTDPCLLNTPPPADRLYVFLDQLNGDATFSNDNQLGGQTIPDFFNAGEPIEVFFAPITVDAESNGMAVFESGPNSPCVDVNAAAAFSVVYLTPIQVSTIGQRITPQGECQGRFFLSGGMPQFSPASVYDIQIRHTTVPGAFGIPVLSSYGHEDEVRFNFTEPGTYEVTVTDEKDCPLIFEIEVGCDDAVIYTLDTLMGGIGSQLCFDVELMNFTDMVTVQWELQWDPTVLEFDSVTDFLIDHDQFARITNNNAAQGIVNVLWIPSNQDLGATVVDGTTYFNICFDVIGDCGDQSVITVGGEIIINDRIDLVIDSNVAIPMVFNPGLAVVESTTFSGRGDICPDDGSRTGSIELTICGGEAPYTVDYTGPSGNGSIPIDPVTLTGSLDNLEAGQYDFSIGDATGDVVIETFEVPMGSAHEVTLDATPPACANNSSNGRVAVMVSPAGDYNYAWSNAAFNTTEIDDLGNGSYQVTVTDQMTGCEVVASTTLNTPPIEVELTALPASCPSSEDGGATATADGGTPYSDGRYTYEWFGVQRDTAITSVVNMLDTGSYSLRVRDSIGCFVDLTYDVSSEFFIQIDTVILDSIQCAGDSAQRLEIAVSSFNFNGTSSYAFEWRLGGQDVSSWFASSTNTVINLVPLPAGIYRLRITDLGISQDCFIETEVTITAPTTPISFEIIDLMNDLCNNLDDGAVTFRAVGGVATSANDYFILWDDPSLPDGGPGLNDGLFRLTSLGADTYFFRLYDNNMLTGCVLDTFITIEEEDGVEIVDIITTPVSCDGGQDGELIVVYSQSSTDPFQVDWVDQDGNMFTGDTISDLAPGTYIVTVTATSGCSVTDTAVLASPNAILLDSVQYQDPSCPDNADGSITVFISSDNPVNYAWSDPNGVDAPTLTGVPAGMYSVTISSSDGCGDLVIDTLNLIARGSFTGTFDNIVATTCAGTCEGSAEVIVTGATGNVQYLWSNGSQNATASMLCGGEQFVVVNDDNCSDTLFVTIPLADSMTITIDATPPGCSGEDDGAISVSVEGSNPPFTITWEDQSNDNPRINLSAGTYGLTVTDIAGCSQERTVELSDADQLTATIRPQDLGQITCAGRDDGSASITVQGGSGGNTFTWTPSVSTTNAAQGLAAGMYSVLVADQAGCTDTVSFTITEPTPIEFTLGDITPIACFGESTPFTVVSATGGLGASYTFSVNNGALIDINQPINLFAGSYLISVFDSAGCFASAPLEIIQPDEIGLDIGPDQEVLLGDSVRLGIVSLTNTFPIDSFFWTSEGDILDCINCPAPWANPTSRHIVTLTVVDSMGCSAMDELELTVDGRRQIYIPTAFSPNNDGINDLFSVFTGRGVRSINSMRVFNRWGAQVFNLGPIDAMDSALIGWDGTANGEELNPDLYVYIIEVEFVDDRVIVYRGEINLMR